MNTRTPKLLSVDDSKMIHMVIGKAFKNYNLELFYASNGVEGLAVATRENPDLILLDVTMPVMDGVETLTKLKSDPTLKDIPVIMLTAEAGKENVVRIAKIGIRDYIIKPFTEGLIAERVGRILDLQIKGQEEGKAKDLEDAANILVVDDKPAIIEQIKEAASSTPWKIIGVGQCAEGVDYTSKEVPDLILISLSMPERGAFNFYQMTRANARTKSVPIFGMSVKTAIEEQSTAQSMGFNAIITKPLDLGELMNRMTRAMNIDTSKRYFAEDKGVVYLTIPAQIDKFVQTDIGNHIVSKSKEMVESGQEKLVIDASKVSKIDMVIIKLFLQIIKSCRDLGVNYKVVGSSDFAEQAKAFEETKDLELFEDRAKALESF
ncbi:MAG: response regulator [Verrucomicrobiota bacterium]